MRTLLSLLYCLGLLLSGSAPAAAQRLNNDGFQRRHGQMHVLRNGQLRPMTRDAHLPTGAVVTKDGFLVTPDGRRTELSEGQGCNLRGQLVQVVPDATGGLALSAPEAARPGATRQRESASQQMRSAMNEQLGGADDDETHEEASRPEANHSQGRGKRGKEHKKGKKKGRKWDD